VKAVCLIYNPRITRAGPLAKEAAGWLDKQGLRTSVGTTEDAHSLPIEGSDLVVALGGDGSILRAAHVAAPHQTLIVGVNLGRVGFLAEASPDNWPEILSPVLSGDFWTEERMMLRATVERDGDMVVQEDALNDIVVGRGAQARVVRLDVEIDGQPLAQYAADGLIVATATGSTAYALAAGGPVLSPSARSIVLVPVAPHLCAPWPLVLSEGTCVRVLPTDGRPAGLTVDGIAIRELSPSDAILVQASPHSTRFARVQQKEYFYATLMDRLVARRQG